MTNLSIFKINHIGLKINPYYTHSGTFNISSFLPVFSYLNGLTTVMFVQICEKKE